MNNNQFQHPQFTNVNMPLTNFKQQQDQFILKAEIQQLRQKLEEQEKKFQVVQFQKEDLEKKVANLEQQLFQRNQNNSNAKNIIEDQNLKDKYIQIQLHNQDLQKQIDQLNEKIEDKKRIEIQSIPIISKNIQEETVRLSWFEKIDNLQISFQRKNRIVEFQGYGEVQNKGFIFQCQCELSRIPVVQTQPQIVQKEHELFLKFQI
ncbi:unnamed protein product [Paramecium primaurelia]|uniref:Uncharacterized protein n=1 Tax=Paramecium primaurelia TaxID=5886 RepID=A0A8S1LDD4_PARPR|nr:unnamed protein product [Paramecium primaurelia]